MMTNLLLFEPRVADIENSQFGFWIFKCPLSDINSVVVNLNIFLVNSKFIYASTDSALISHCIDMITES